MGSTKRLRRVTKVLEGELHTRLSGVDCQKVMCISPVFDLLCVLGI